MERKINQVGTGTLTVSLPASWAKYHHLKKGDTVDVVEEENKLVLYKPKSLEKNERIVLKIEGNDEKNLLRPIFSLYVRGVNEIEVHYEFQQMIDYMRKALYSLTGFDIVEEGTNYCVLKNIANLDEKEFEPSMKRLFETVIRIARESYALIKNKEYNTLSVIGEVDRTLNKLCIFCERLVNTSGYRLVNKPSLMYFLLVRIEHIGDFYKHICNYLMKQKKKFDLQPEVLQIYEKTIKMLEFLYSMYRDYNPNKYGLLRSMKKEVIDKGHKLFEIVPKKQIRIVHYIVEIAGKIDNASSPMTGLEKIEK